jgi:hypothetical protein
MMLPSEGWPHDGFSHVATVNKTVPVCPCSFAEREQKRKRLESITLVEERTENGRWVGHKDTEAQSGESPSLHSG